MPRTHKMRGMFRVCSFFALVALTLPMAVAASPLAVVGTARVIDGDTIAIGDRRIRLHGIDAPERHQTCERRNNVWGCGKFAQTLLSDLIGGEEVVCDITVEHDKYDRSVAVCSVAGRDLGRQMVQDGAAFAYVEYSAQYVGEEAFAKAAGFGIWAGHVVTPARYRHPTSDPSGPCQIKGNIGSSGERIYHIRGQQYFLETLVNKPGERMFCTEAEGRAAGFRPAKQ